MLLQALIISNESICCLLAVLVDIDPVLQKQLQFSMVKPSGERKKRKKREIRVFVSSTFRDFKAEREELIKKTFREVWNFEQFLGPQKQIFLYTKIIT